MSEENNQNDNNRNDAPNEDPAGNNRGSGGELLVQFLKVLGITVAVIVLLIVVAFGLLVGFCALSARH